MPATVLWTTDPAAESRVKRLGGTLVVAKGIPLKEIDIHGSRANNARLDTPFNQELALEYALSQESGDRFPYPILRRQDKGKLRYSVLSGNHRIGAAEINQAETIDAYILDSTDEQVIELTCRSANRWMGDRQNKEEAIEHARAMMAKYGHSATSMAKVFGLNEKALQTAIRAEVIRDTLEKNLVDASTLPRVHLIALSPLSDNEEVLRKAGLAAIRFKMRHEDVRKMSADVQAARDEASMLKAVTKWEMQMEEQRPKAVPGTRVKAQKADPRSRVMRQMNGLIDFLDHGGPGRKPFMSLSQLRVTSPEDKKALAAKFRELKACLKRCFDGEGLVYRANGHTSTAKHTRRKPRKAVKRG